VSRRPDFLVIGAMRSGTTSLARWLRAHPQAFVPVTKELHFFDLHWDEGPAWYERHFAAAHPASTAGEATPNYLYHRDVPDRIAEVLPDVRLVAVLRDPVDRAWSHYWMNVQKGRERLSFEDALAAEPERLAAEAAPWRWAYVDRGHYVEQLRRYEERFGRDRMHVLLFDDMRADAAAAYGGVCRFLGIDDAEVPEEVGRPANAYRRVRSHRVARLGKRLPVKLRDAVGRLNTQPARYPPMDESTRSRLAEHFAPHNAALAGWLARDLSAWGRPPAPTSDS
jgi:hypothetical protein